MCSSEVICLCQRLYSIQAFCGLEKGNISMITIQAQTKRTPSGYNWNIFMVNLKKNHQSSPLCPAFWWNTPITFFWEARRETVRFFAASFLFQLFCFVVSRKQEKKMSSSVDWSKDIARACESAKHPERDRGFMAAGSQFARVFMLYCMHVFCRGCLFDAMLTTPELEPSFVVTCPVCRKRSRISYWVSTKSNCE